MKKPKPKDECETCAYNNKRLCGKDFCGMPYCIKDKPKSDSSKL